MKKVIMISGRLVDANENEHETSLSIYEENGKFAVSFSYWDNDKAFVPDNHHDFYTLGKELSKE